MRIVHSLAYSGGDKGGGIASAVPYLVEACYERGVGTEIVSQTWEKEKVFEVSVGKTRHFARTSDRTGFGYSGELRKLLKDRVANGDIIHSHGLWMYINYLAHKTSSHLRKPHLISPHGMLTPWALAHSGWKKRPMRLLFQDRSIRNAFCLHALSTAEAVDIRALGFTNPIVVIPNGINLADYAKLPSKVVLMDKFPQLKGQKIILFLGRIHPKKGLLHLVEAWSQLAEQAPEWHLVIAGPDEVGHRALVEEAIYSSGVIHQTTFLGMVYEDEKLAALAAADVFVLPSFSEGFSMAILEAMICKLPVLLTPECNFSGAAEAGAAIEVAPNSRSTQEGLRLLLKMTDQEREEMGLRGHALVADNYSWDRIAEEFICVYEWCLGGGTTPATVQSAC